MASESHAPDSKTCACCGGEFIRPYGISATQWKNRVFCSKRCSGEMKRSTVSDDEIVNKYVNGMSSNEIAREVRLSGTQIVRVLKKRGIKLRPASENKTLSHSRPEVREKISASRLHRPLSESAKLKLRQQVGPVNALWRGGITKTSGGYLMYTSSSANGENAGKLVHQVVGEQKYGRSATLGWHFHHVDGNKLNNNPSNILLMTDRAHIQLHNFLRKEKRCGK